MSQFEEDRLLKKGLLYQLNYNWGGSDISNGVLKWPCSLETQGECMFELRENKLLIAYSINLQSEEKEMRKFDLKKATVQRIGKDHPLKQIGCSFIVTKQGISSVDEHGFLYLEASGIKERDDWINNFVSCGVKEDDINEQKNVNAISEPILKQGVLYKRGGRVKKAKIRSFLLFNNRLEYYKQQKYKKILGVIPLGPDIKLETQEYEENFKCVWKITFSLQVPKNNRKYIFFCQTGYDRALWLISLKRIGSTIPTKSLLLNVNNTGSDIGSDSDCSSRNTSASLSTTLRNSLGAMDKKKILGYRQESQGGVCIKKSYMYKRGGKVKNWRQRYFILYPNRLEYFKTNCEKIPLGIVHIFPDTKVSIVEEPTKCEWKFCFSVRQKKGRKFLLSCNTADERNLWHSTVSEVVSKLSEKEQDGTNTSTQEANESSDSSLTTDSDDEDSNNSESTDSSTTEEEEDNDTEKSDELHVGFMYYRYEHEKKWKKYFFGLKKNKLYFAPNETDQVAEDVFLIIEESTILPVDWDTLNPIPPDNWVSTFSLANPASKDSTQTGKVLYLACQKLHEAEEWLGAILTRQLEYNREEKDDINEDIAKKSALSRITQVKCKLCKKNFNFLRSKNACQKCGLIICGDCMFKAEAVDNEGDLHKKLNRWCIYCGHGYRVGDRLWLNTDNGQQNGILRYIGSAASQDNGRLGVELKQPNGTHDGTVDGVQYFTCPTNHGLFSNRKYVIAWRSALEFFDWNVKKPLDPHCQEIGRRWYMSSGANILKQKSSHTYRAYQDEKMEITEENKRNICKDVDGGTDADCYKMASTSKFLRYPPTGDVTKNRETLKQILFAYTRRNPKIGYCQGMNFIVHLLLAFMKEEDVFWTLCVIVEKIKIKDFYLNIPTPMNGCTVERDTFGAICAASFPKINKKCGIQFVNSLEILTPKFLISLGIDQVPLPVNLIMLDSFFTGGGDIGLFPCLLGLVGICENELLSCDHPITVLEKKCQTVEPQKLLAIMKGRQSVPIKTIILIRTGARKRLKSLWTVSSPQQSTEIRVLSKSSNFSIEKVREFQEKFGKNLNDDHAKNGLDRPTFEKFIQHGNLGKFDEAKLNKLFIQCDLNLCGRVKFQDLLCCLTVLSEGDKIEKMKLSFSIYDTGGSNSLNKKEVSRLSKVLASMLDKTVMSPDEQSTTTTTTTTTTTHRKSLWRWDNSQIIVKFVDKLLVMDGSGEGVSKKIFVQGLQSEPTFLRLFN